MFALCSRRSETGGNSRAYPLAVEGQGPGHPGDHLETSTPIGRGCQQGSRRNRINPCLFHQARVVRLGSLTRVSNIAIRLSGTRFLQGGKSSLSVPHRSGAYMPGSKSVGHREWQRRGWALGGPSHPAGTEACCEASGPDGADRQGLATGFGEIQALAPTAPIVAYCMPSSPRPTK